MSGSDEWGLRGGGDRAVSGCLVVEVLLLLLVLVLLGFLAASRKLLISNLAVVHLILLRCGHGRHEEACVDLRRAGADFGSGKVRRVEIIVGVGAVALTDKILRVTFLSPINLHIYLFLRVVVLTLHFVRLLVAGLFCRSFGVNEASAPLICHHMRGNLLVR